jgi:methylated-DNA-[protein]-cysteine S-methyltransferase
MELFSAYIFNELGYIVMTADTENVLSVNFSDTEPEVYYPNEVLELCKKQLEEYFNGSGKAFSLPLHLHGTIFQQTVWKELMNISFGQVVTYSQLAIRLGNIKKIRAVGMANARNLVNIIVPCHRVIGASGKLVGYGGGLWRKKWLLDFEGSMYDLKFN